MHTPLSCKKDDDDDVDDVTGKWGWVKESCCFIVFQDVFHYFFSLSGTSPLTCRETYMCMCHWVLFDFVQSTLVYTLTVTQANNL